MWASQIAGRRLAGALVALALLLASPWPAGADAEAEAAIRGWIEDIVSGDPQRPAASLAPEFQVLRSDGKGYGKADDVAGGTARITGRQAITDMGVTRRGDLLVVRYMLAVEQTIQGREVQGKAPRLTVFRRADNRWLVVAHANFARIE